MLQSYSNNTKMKFWARYEISGVIIISKRVFYEQNPENVSSKYIIKYKYYRKNEMKLRNVASTTNLNILMIKITKLKNKAK